MAGKLGEADVSNLAGGMLISVVLERKIFTIMAFRTSEVMHWQKARGVKQVLITDEKIAPYREKGSKVYINDRHPLRTGYHIPPQSLTASEELFAKEWRQGDRLSVIALIGYMSEVPLLHANYDWYGIAHRCGGQTHVDFNLVATRLNVRPGISDQFTIIAEKFYGLASGHFHRGEILASQIVSYSNCLNEIGLDCESTWEWLTEGVYPIDATQANLDLISENPPRLSDLMLSGKNPVRFHKSCAIFLLAENSD